MTLTYDQAQHILTQAKAADVCESQCEAAARALNRNDLEGFERVCRALHVWLAQCGIDYTMTDGLGEEFHPDGTLKWRCTYNDGKRQGLAEWFRPDGTLTHRCTYKDGEWDGPDEEFYPDGTLKCRYIHKDGQLDGLAEEFYPDGTLEYQYTYKDGVRQ
jgi:hypothetical protein